MEESTQGEYFKSNFEGSIQAFLNKASERGVTYMLDAAVLPATDKNVVDPINNQPEYLKSLAKRNCPVRISGALLADTLENYNTQIEQNGYSPKGGDKEFNMPFIKVLADGSNQGLTGYQYTPYECDDTYTKYSEYKDIRPYLEPNISFKLNDDDIHTNRISNATFYILTDGLSIEQVGIDAVGSGEIIPSNKLITTLKAVNSDPKKYNLSVNIENEKIVENAESVTINARPGQVEIINGSDGDNHTVTKKIQPLQMITLTCESKVITKAQQLANQTNTGVFNYGYPLEFNSMIRKAIDQGWSVMVHANGDHAMERTINAFDHPEISTMDKHNQRHRIEHASLLSDQNLSDMKQLNISPSFLIGHVGYWGKVFQGTIFGYKKSNLLDRCNSAIKNHNMRISLHSDYSVTPLGPLRMMEQAISRIMEASPKTEVLNKTERISPLEALKAVTYDAAWQCHADQWVGSIESEKCADFVLLEQNPLTYRNGTKEESYVNNMRNIKVLQTWKGGVLRYASDGSHKQPEVITDTEKPVIA